MVIHRGEVWLADLSPTRGREQSGQRPVVVISDDRFNAGPVGLVIVVPFTTRRRGAPNHAEVQPPDGGLHQVSFAMCEQVRSLAIERLRGRPLGNVSSAVLSEVSSLLRNLLAMP